MFSLKNIGTCDNESTNSKDELRKFQRWPVKIFGATKISEEDERLDL